MSILFCLLTEVSNWFQAPFDYGIYECKNMSVIPLLLANDGIEQTLFMFELCERLLRFSCNGSDIISIIVSCFCLECGLCHS